MLSRLVVLVILLNNPSPTDARVADGGGAAAAAPSTPSVISEVQIVPSIDQCQLKSTCHGLTLSAVDSNCHCDELCLLYDDCCYDYVNIDRIIPRQPPRSTISCQRLVDVEIIEQSVTDEFYIVSRCPKSYRDVNVRRRCEQTSLNPADRFYRVPVVAFHLLYRNIYCAICMGAHHPRPVFWNAVIRCADQLTSNRTLTDSLQSADCSTVFVDPESSTHHRRRCKSHIARCDRNWADATVAGRCRRRGVSYVYAGNRAFKNRDCALCNHVNETYIGCDDNRRTAGQRVSAGDDQVPFSVTLDFNKQHTLTTVRSLRTDRQTDTVAPFPPCHLGRLYDPFNQECRLLFCPVGYTLINDRCTLETALPDDLSNVDSATSTSLDLMFDCRAIVIVNSTDYFRLDNGSLVIVSAQRILKRNEYQLVDNLLHVCLSSDSSDWSTASFNFTVFPFVAADHCLASLVGAVISLSTLLTAAVAHSFVASLRSGTAGKTVACVVVCLLVSQLTYFAGVPLSRFISDVRRSCFYVSVINQFSTQATFFWLNVFAVNVYRTINSSSGRPYRFIVCSLYASIVPGVIVSGCLAISLTNIDGSADSSECWTLGLSQQLIRMLSPVFVLVVSMSLFTVTMCRICHHQVSRDDVERSRLVPAIHLTMIVALHTVTIFIGTTVSAVTSSYLFIVSNTLHGPLVCLVLIAARHYPSCPRLLSRTSPSDVTSRRTVTVLVDGRWKYVNTSSQQQYPVKNVPPQETCF